MRLTARDHGRAGTLVMALALLGPTAALSQDRAAELEARQASRTADHLERRGERPSAWPGAWPGGWQAACVPPAPGRPPAFGGSFTEGLSRCWSPFVRPGWPIYRLPNPYEDWATLWGRGWLDDTPVPPYHRFQYRFFPETLPDPTRQGYVLPPGGAVAPGVTPARPVAGQVAGCVRIDMELVDGDAEAFLAALPALGAITTEAFSAVVRDRLARGAGVTLRSVDGFVHTLPAPESIQRLLISDC